MHRTELPLDVERDPYYETACESSDLVLRSICANNFLMVRLSLPSIGNAASSHHRDAESQETTLHSTTVLTHEVNHKDKTLGQKYIPTVMAKGVEIGLLLCYPTSWTQAEYAHAQRMISFSLGYAASAVYGRYIRSPTPNVCVRRMFPNDST